MNLTTSLLILFLAAVLEAGGDALIRSGLPGNNLARLLFLLGGGLVLFGYGCLVNFPPWDFGKLLGVYVVFFFLVAQAISWIAFDQRPEGATLLGGALIVAGGVVISYSSLSNGGPLK